MERFVCWCVAKISSADNAFISFFEERSFRVFDFDGTGRVSSTLVKDVLTYFKNDKQFLRGDEDYANVLGSIITELERANGGKISFDDFMMIMIKTTLEQHAVDELDISRPSPRNGASLNRRASTLIENVTFSAIDLAENTPAVVAEHYIVGDYIRVGRLYKCIHKESGEERVLKVLPKSRSDPMENEKTLNIYLTLMELDHPR